MKSLKSTLLASAAVLMMAGPAFAASEADITQAGNYGLGKIEQYGDTEIADITQTSTAYDSKGSIYQGKRNPQGSYNNRSYIRQSADHNTGTINQDGMNNLASIDQSGNYNTATIDQFGNNKTSHVNQSGRNNQATVLQR